MMKKTIFVLLLSMGLSACESGAPDGSTQSKDTKPATQVATTPAPVSPTPAASPTIATQLKAGDAVKVKFNGVVAEATVVSVDNKSDKVTVKLKKDGKESTVAASDIVRP